MLIDFLEQKLHQSLCFLLLADYCMRLNAENPMEPADLILNQFVASIKSEIIQLREQAQANNQNIDELKDAETLIDQYIEGWKQGLAQQFAAIKK